MKQFWLFSLTLCLWLGFGLPPDASGSGELVGYDDPGCYDAGALKNATFTPARFTYVFAGTCDLAITRLNLPTKVPWTGVGTYDPPTGQTKEDIIVPTPRLDQPSRPYGRFQATMHCNADPWLNPNITCDQISPTVWAPLDNTAPNAMGWKQPYPLGPIITGSIQNSRQPFTSGIGRASLNAQYQAHLAAERKTERFRRVISQPPASVGPLVGGAQPPRPNPPAYGATYKPNPISSLNRGQTITVGVQVTNTGSLIWTPANPNPFRLSYHWFQGTTEVISSGLRTNLAGPVGFNQSAVLNANLRAPSNPGTYTLKWDMIQEGITWFRDKGVPPGNQTVVVK